MKDLLFACLVHLSPRRTGSRMVGWLMARRLWSGLWRRLALGCFARALRIDLAEAEKSIDEYVSLQDLFTRRLKAGLRPIGQSRAVMAVPMGDLAQVGTSPAIQIRPVDPMHTILPVDGTLTVHPVDGTLTVHPVDGTLTVCGVVTQGLLLQIKGWTYELKELLGNEALARSLEGAEYSVYYLCPSDYHRVHAPFAGQIVACRHIPGELWPVNPWSVRSIRNLFTRNERVVVEFRTQTTDTNTNAEAIANADAAVVFVGATNVGQMRMAFDASVVTNQWLAPRLTRTYAPPISVRPGDELGTFLLGSTVVVIKRCAAPFLGSSVSLLPMPVRMGQLKT